MLYFRQNGMLYVNQMKSYQAEPPRFNMPDFEEVWITCADGVKIFAWLIRREHTESSPPQPAFLGVSLRGCLWLQIRRTARPRRR